jgi:hypothetical protein
MAGIAIALGMTASGAEVSRLVKARLVISGDVRVFRHDISISNKGESRRVVAVVLWQDAGLPVPPKTLSAPKGWEVRSVQQEGDRGSTWTVEFRCISEPSANSGSGGANPPPSDDEIRCGIRAGQTVSFQVVLPFPAEIPDTQRILVGFSDGRLGVASR